MKQQATLLAIVLASVLGVQPALFSDQGGAPAASPAPQAATSPASGATRASVAGAKITGVLILQITRPCSASERMAGKPAALATSA